MVNIFEKYCKNVLTNIMGGAIIITSKGNTKHKTQNIKQQIKFKNHSIHSIYKCSMKRMNTKKGKGDTVGKVVIHLQYEK